jgi:hypothetical protein
VSNTVNNKDHHLVAGLDIEDQAFALQILSIPASREDALMYVGCKHVVAGNPSGVVRCVQEAVDNGLSPFLRENESVRYVEKCLIERPFGDKTNAIMLLAAQYVIEKPGSVARSQSQITKFENIYERSGYLAGQPPEAPALRRLTTYQQPLP